MIATSRSRGLKSNSRIDSFRSAGSETSATPAFDVAQQALHSELCVHGLTPHTPKQQ